MAAQQSYLLTAISCFKQATNGLVPKVVQVHVLEAELGDGSRKVRADRCAAVWKDTRAVARLTVCDLEGVVTGRVEERHNLVISEPVLRVFAIADDYGLCFRVEVPPFQTAYFA